jgi:hypothetical protein
MSFYIRHKDTVFCWQMEAATVGAILQAAIWTICKGLGWL